MVVNMKDTDFLFLTAMLRAREAKMLTTDKIERMLDAQSFDDAAKLLTDCGYPDMSGMSVSETEKVLAKRRFDDFYELSGNEEGRKIADIFKTKYDYHNVKVLVKSMAANEDASRLLSDAGRVNAEKLTEAFISGERSDLPPAVKTAISGAVGVMSRTGDAQLADIAVDKSYFAELSALADEFGDDFISGYIRLLIDSANLRTIVRALRTGRDGGFLAGALIPGGNIGSEEIASMYQGGAGITDIFKSDALTAAVRLGAEALGGGSQTEFELTCDNAVFVYISKADRISFGAAPVAAYLVKLEWEITSIRMILTGKLAGVSPDVIRERLRDCHV